MVTKASQTVRPALSRPCAQDHRLVASEVAHQALLLVEVDRHALVVVIADLAEEHRVLRQRQQAALERGHRHAGGRMRMDHAVHVVARLVDRAVDHEAGLVDAVAGAGIEHQPAVEVDFHEARGGDFLVGVSIGVDEEVTLLAGHAARDVVVDQVVHAEQRDQPVAGRDVHAHRPLFGTYPVSWRYRFRLRKIAHGRCLLTPELSHAAL
jgi:hypothetical protein